jgi:hypothetical protein
MVFLFFAAAPYRHSLWPVGDLSVYFLDIVIDNTFARVKWRLFGLSWLRQGDRHNKSDDSVFAGIGKKAHARFESPGFPLYGSAAMAAISSSVLSTLSMILNGLGHHTGNPKHADILQVTGAVNEQNARPAAAVLADA